MATAGWSSAPGSAGTGAPWSCRAFASFRARSAACLARIGARELPLLFAVLRGRLSFVGPRALPAGTGYGHTGPRRLMAPGLTGPAQRGCGHESLDDAYVQGWTLWVDALLLVGRCPKLHQSVSNTSS